MLLLSTRFLSRTSLRGSQALYLNARRTQAYSARSLAWSRDFSSSRVVSDPTRKKDAEDGVEAEEGEKKKKKPARSKKAAAKPKKEKKVKEPPKPKPIKLTKANKPPKKPSPPWTRFMSKFAAENEERAKTSIAGLAKEASVVWQAMNETEKEPYREAYYKDKVEYDEKFKEYCATVSPAVVKEINHRRHQKGLPKLHFRHPTQKRPLSAFLRFSETRRQSLGVQFHSIKDAAAFAKESGEKWRDEMSEEEKKVYRDAYEADVKVWEEGRKEAEREKAEEA